MNLVSRLHYHFLLASKPKKVAQVHVNIPLGSYSNDNGDVNDNATNLHK